MNDDGMFLKSELMGRNVNLFTVLFHNLSGQTENDIPDTCQIYNRNKIHYDGSNYKDIQY